MSKPGKTPSLIGSAAGATRFAQAGKKRTCKRGDCDIQMGEYCAEVHIPGTMGHKTYCLDCYQKILEQTQKDLDKLKADVAKKKK
ncbi:MAG: hypothetical protein AB1424_15325 [Thermodesulfobacteriota bacterium]